MTFPLLCSAAEPILRLLALPPRPWTVSPRQQTRAPGESTARVTEATRRYRARSLTHLDDDGVAPEAEHQPRPLRLQVHDHARLVLQPEIPATRRADRKPVAALPIR